MLPRIVLVWLIVAHADPHFASAQPDEVPESQRVFVQVEARIPDFATPRTLTGRSPTHRVSFALWHQGQQGRRIQVRICGDEPICREQIGLILYDIRGKRIGRIPSSLYGNGQTPGYMWLNAKQGLGAIVQCKVGRKTEVRDDEGMPLVTAVAAGEYYLRARFLYSTATSQIASDEWQATGRVADSGARFLRIIGREERDDPRWNSGMDEELVTCEIELSDASIIDGEPLRAVARVVNFRDDAIGLDTTRIKGTRAFGSTGHTLAMKDRDGKVGAFCASQMRFSDLVDNLLPSKMFLAQKLRTHIPPWKDKNWDGPDYSRDPNFTNAPLGLQTIEAVWHYRLMTDGGPAERAKAILRQREREMMAAPEEEAIPDESEVWKVTPVAKGAIYIEEAPRQDDGKK